LAIITSSPFWTRSMSAESWAFASEMDWTTILTSWSGLV
jgi:hypothetical protein